MSIFSSEQTGGMDKHGSVTRREYLIVSPVDDPVSINILDSKAVLFPGD